MLPLAHPRMPEAKVPCNGCTACCHHALIFILPEHGDQPELYDSFPAIHPLTGEPGQALRQKQNGDCAHLGPNGCGIYDHRPAICRVYSCVRMLRQIGDRHAQRRAVRDGRITKEVYQAGKARMATLE